MKNFSDGKADLPGGGRIVAGQLGGALRQPPVAQERDQGLHRGTEKTALPGQQIEILSDQRREIEAG